MSYRKVTVNGKVYEYVIGKVFVKIKDFGLFKVADVGNRIVNSGNFRATPATVASIIQKEPLPRIFHCKTHGVNTIELVYDPFDIEFRGKRTTMINCKECYENRRMDI